jgi:serine/threonine protein kinase
MTQERFRQIRNLFEAALERPPEARAAFLEEACLGDQELREEVDRLLSAHQQTEGVLDRPALLRGDTGRMEGRTIDHYEILRELGRGGMGSVYLAVRTDQVYRKAVALKIVRPEASSEDVVRRFRQEREIVAGLDHPNIARLLDGGTTPEGLPYFVMEYVDGQPIDRYCDERQLSVAERLKLFRLVCAAVQYAHGRGVAHRDLKPGNILVTAEGVVKLLDFGIAKLLGAEGETVEQLTRTGLRPMTPEYASPEQVRGDSVGAASDQYSLGVVLYELLTGHRPYRMRSRLIHEVVRVICEEDPTLPSTAVRETAERIIAEKPVPVTPQLISRSRETTPDELRRELSGDLDNILLRTLRKDPPQRYASVKDFGDDLQRRLDGQPITARPQSLVYRADKFLKRHRGWVMAGVILAAGLATGMIRINLFGMAFLFCVAFGMIATFFRARREVGERYARTEFASMMAGQVAVTIGAIGWAMFAIAHRDSLGSEESGGLRTLIYLALALGLVALVGLLRWPWRNRWAGKLLLDAGIPRPWYEILSGVVVLGMLALAARALVISSRANPQHGWKWQAAGLVALAVAFAFVFALRGRLEIRERGIVYFGVLWRWQRLESFAWEYTEGPRVILKLRLKRFPILLLWPAASFKLVFPAGKRNAADAILSRQLSEWPGAGAAPLAPAETQ